MCARLWVTLLYVAATVLPLYGISNALMTVARAALGHRNHERTMAALRKERDQLIAAAAITDKDQVAAKANQRLEEEAGGLYNVPGQTGVLAFVSHNESATKKFKGLLYDLLFVGAGVVAGGIASIWSVWIGIALP